MYRLCDVFSRASVRPHVGVDHISQSADHLHSMGSISVIMKVHLTMRDRAQPATAISQQERTLFCDADRRAHKVGLSQLVQARPGQGAAHAQ